MRIAKALAMAGIASRRKSEEHIRNGAVKVNGQVVTNLATQVDLDNDAIQFRSRLLRFKKPIYFMLNKPTGFVTTVRDKAVSKTVFELLPKSLVSASRNPSDRKTRVFPVGRLDKDSTGLLLFTNDGEVANRLMHPRYGVPKWYEVRLERPFEMKDKQALLKGIYLSEGLAKASKIIIRSKSRRILHIMLLEGRNREVRRILAALDYKVKRLTRFAVGPIRLGGLPRGGGRLLADSEIKALRESIGC